MDLNFIEQKLLEKADSIAETFLTRLEGQPYSVSCKTCRRYLEYGSRVDMDGDLIVEVKPCLYCLDKAAENGP